MKTTWNASASTSKTGGRLTGKDLINVGIFTAIYFVVVFAVACLGFIPILMAAICGIIPLIAGIPYMLFLTRARKFGMITILGLLTGIIMFITGMGYFSMQQVSSSGSSQTSSGNREATRRHCVPSCRTACSVAGLSATSCRFSSLQTRTSPPCAPIRRRLRE